MILTEEPRYTFYPDVNGNLELPEAERLSVEIIRPTGFQTKEMTSVKVSREYYQNDQPYDDEGNPKEPAKYKNISTEIIVNADYILRTCVGAINNLQVQNKDKLRKITTGSELADCRAYGVKNIVDAICSEIISDKISDAKKKNLE